MLHGVFGILRMAVHFHAERVNRVLQQRQRLLDGPGTVLVNQLQRLLQIGGHSYRLADTRRCANICAGLFQASTRYTAGTAHEFNCLLLDRLNSLGMDLLVLNLRGIPTSAERLDQVHRRDHLLAE